MYTGSGGTTSFGGVGVSAVSALVVVVTGDVVVSVVVAVVSVVVGEVSAVERENGEESKKENKEDEEVVMPGVGEEGVWDREGEENMAAREARAPGTGEEGKGGCEGGCVCEGWGEVGRGEEGGIMLLCSGSGGANGEMISLSSTP